MCLYENRTKFVCLVFDNLKCPPVAIPRGRVRLRSRGRIAKYSCIRGYQVLGEKYSTCLRGRWDPPPPVCISKYPNEKHYI